VAEKNIYYCTNITRLSPKFDLFLIIDLGSRLIVDSELKDKYQIKTTPFTVFDSEKQAIFTSQQL
jgi:hypothetical protein